MKSLLNSMHLTPMKHSKESTTYVAWIKDRNNIEILLVVNKEFLNRVLYSIHQLF